MITKRRHPRRREGIIPRCVTVRPVLDWRKTTHRLEVAATRLLRLRGWFLELIQAAHRRIDYAGANLLFCQHRLQFRCLGCRRRQRDLAGTAPPRPRRSLAAAADVSFLALRRPGVPGPRRRVPRFAGSVRRKRRLWRYRRRGARSVDAGLAARRAWR